MVACMVCPPLMGTRRYSSGQSAPGACTVGPGTPATRGAGMGPREPHARQPGGCAVTNSWDEGSRHNRTWSSMLRGKSRAAGRRSRRRRGPAAATSLPHGCAFSTSHNTPLSQISSTMPVVPCLSRASGSAHWWPRNLPAGGHECARWWPSNPATDLAARAHGTRTVTSATATRGTTPPGRPRMDSTASSRPGNRRSTSSRRREIVRRRPSGTLRMSPASRSVLRWWENVDFGTSGPVAWHCATVSCRLGRRVRGRGPAGPGRSARTAPAGAARPAGPDGGLACGRGEAVDISVRLSWNNSCGIPVGTVRYNSNGRSLA